MRETREQAMRGKNRALMRVSSARLLCGSDPRNPFNTTDTRGILMKTKRAERFRNWCCSLSLRIRDSGQRASLASFIDRCGNFEAWLIGWRSLLRYLDICADHLVLASWISPWWVRGGTQPPGPVHWSIILMGCDCILLQALWDVI